MDDLDICGPADSHAGVCELQAADGKGIQWLQAAAIVFVFALAANASAADYNIRISFDPAAFLGPCNDTAVESNELGAYGECIGNFFSPVFPNPVGILAPVQGERLQEKIDAVNFLDIDKFVDLGITGLVSKLVNIPILFFGTILEILAATIMFLLVFGFKFIFVYLFYVSLGFQAILFYLDSNSQGMDPLRRTHLTFWIMGISTILMMSYGAGWIT